MTNDPEIVDTVLCLLRQYGWEMGLLKLEAAIQATPDPKKQEGLQFFTGWMAAERGAYEDAHRWFEECKALPKLAAWALFGQAFLAMRQHVYDRFHELLTEAERQPSAANDQALRASIEHVRGARFFHEGRPEQALVHLRSSLALFGKDHFGTGRVLDTFGMVYAGKDNFHAAEEFYRQAIACKQRFDDQAGLAVSHGNLGRLYLDWGYFTKARHFFEEDLRISQTNLDKQGEAQMYNWLGQVELALGALAAAAGRTADARRHWKDAADLLDTSIARAVQHQWPVSEAYARKDRALLHLAQDGLAEAEAQAQRAEQLFRTRRFEEGVAHVQRVWGGIYRRQGRFDESLRILRAALVHFTKFKEQPEVARTQLEIARTTRAARGPRPEITREYRRALQEAESCRRSELVRETEEEWRGVDADAYCAHVYRRVRGRLVTEDPTSLITGTRETLTVLYLDLKGSTDFALGRDPEEVMLTLNQMMADFVEVLRKSDGQVSAFRGDGFLALFRARDHAVRAVTAALDLFTRLQEFNQPREVLELPLFRARVGIATGPVFLGNVGTYDKMDYTAIGTTVNRGARLETIAEPEMPCICGQTFNDVRDRFVYRAGSPRTVDLKGLGKEDVWDVVGRTGSG
jgi:class 3 adenylate cyclase